MEKITKPTVSVLAAGADFIPDLSFLVLRESFKRMSKFQIPELNPSRIVWIKNFYFGNCLLDSKG